MKTPTLKSLFNKVPGLKTNNFIKKFTLFFFTDFLFFPVAASKLLKVH